MEYPQIRPSGLRKWFLRTAAVTVLLFLLLGLGVVFILRDVLHLTSSNAVLYVIRKDQGTLAAVNDLSIEDADRLLFSFDLNWLYSWLSYREAMASRAPILDVTWDESSGKGVIKQFRPDGTMFSVTFSRFRSDGREAKGLFIGGELPYGDHNRSKGGETSGISYFDGNRWSHIWCAANEGISFMNQTVYMPVDWKYLSGRVLKLTDSEVILESSHELSAEGKKVLMRRVISMSAGDDYLTLHVDIQNAGGSPIEFNYTYGDEPWVGKFSNSLGDVGWTESGLVMYEGDISPSENRYAGYWDYGNDAASERHEFSGHANFIRWIEPLPSGVYFSNDFARCCSREKPLDSHNNRIINVVWEDQVIFPGERRTYKLAVGMAGINKATGFPEVRLSED